MAELIVEEPNLLLHLPVTQKVLGFHFDIRVPLTAVVSVAPIDNPWMALRGRRMAGTALRGSTAVGTWIHGNKEFDFCVVRTELKAVQLDLSSGRFSRFLVCVPDDVDPREEAVRIADAAGIARPR